MLGKKYQSPGLKSCPVLPERPPLGALISSSVGTNCLIAKKLVAFHEEKGGNVECLLECVPAVLHGHLLFAFF